MNGLLVAFGNLLTMFIHTSFYLTPFSPSHSLFLVPEQETKDPSHPHVSVLKDTETPIHITRKPLFCLFLSLACSLSVSFPWAHYLLVSTCPANLQLPSFSKLVMCLDPKCYGRSVKVSFLLLPLGTHCSVYIYVLQRKSTVMVNSESIWAAYILGVIKVSVRWR